MSDGSQLKGGTYYPKKDRTWVRVAEADEVERGVVLGVMEAIRMELSLQAAFAGTVTNVSAIVGRQVPLGAPLFTVEARK